MRLQTSTPRPMFAPQETLHATRMDGTQVGNFHSRRETHVRACVRHSYALLVALVLRMYLVPTRHYVQVDVFDFKYTMQLNISPGIQSDTPHPRRRSM